MKKLSLLLFALVAAVTTASAWELTLDVKGAQYIAEAATERHSISPTVKTN
mgnify:CR=1 FL=1